MTQQFRLSAVAAALLAVAGCAQTNTGTVTRDTGTALTFHQDARTDALPSEQAAALKAQARKIVKGSTLRGAAIGAALGCSIGVATGNSSKCLASAAVGAAGGALIGNSQGRKSVSKRMALSGSTDLARDIRAADAQLEFASRLDTIRRDRAALAEALDLTAQQSRIAAQNLSQAASRGQSGLDWHITRTGQIAKQATSARSTISLL